MLEFKQRFKENIKNLFLTTSEFVSKALILHEHFDKEETKSNLKEVEKQFYLKFLGFENKVQDLASEFFEEFYQVSEIAKIEGLEAQKRLFQEEADLIENQYMELKNAHYNNALLENEQFKSKLDDFVRIVSPDDEYSSEVERKELWILSLTEKDLKVDGTNVVAGEDYNDKDCVIGEDGTFAISDNESENGAGNKNQGMSTPPPKITVTKAQNPILSQIRNWRQGSKVFFTELQGNNSFTVGTQDGGILTSSKGVFVWKLITEQDVYLDQVKIELPDGTMDASFLDIISFGDRYSFMAATTLSDLSLIFEVEHSIHGASITKIANFSYAPNGKILRKTPCHTAIAYPIDICSFEIMTSPINRDLSERYRAWFEFSFEDWLLIGTDKVLAVSREGTLGLQTYRGDRAGCMELQFDLDLEPGEAVTAMVMDSSNRFVAISSISASNLYRIFVYNVDGSMLSHAAEYCTSGSMFSDVKGVVRELDFTLYDGMDPVLLAFESGDSQGIRVFKLKNGSKLEEVNYLSEYFFGRFVASVVHLNCLWTIDSFGTLKMTHQDNVLPNPYL